MCYSVVLFCSVADGGGMAYDVCSCDILTPFFFFTIIETPQYIRALITAPLPGPTPYSGGVSLSKSTLVFVHII